MRDLFDRRGRRGGARPDDRLPGGEAPVEVVTYRGKVYLRLVGVAPAVRAERPDPPGMAHQAPLVLGVVLLAGVVVAAVAFSAAFAAFEVAPRALPEGSLTAPRPDGARALARERNRRREALVRYDRHIEGGTDDPHLEAAWRDLKQHEVEALEQLERHLGRGRASHPLPAAVDAVPRFLETSVP